jgi:hypothetical protein
VTPPKVKRKRKPRVHKETGPQKIGAPKILANHLKILIPVGTAIIIVALVKYLRVSTSRPTVNMWWAQTTQPRKPILNIA